MKIIVIMMPRKLVCAPLVKTKNKKIIPVCITVCRSLRQQKTYPRFVYNHCTKNEVFH